MVPLPPGFLPRVTRARDYRLTNIDGAIYTNAARLHKWGRITQTGPDYRNAPRLQKRPGVTQTWAVDTLIGSFGQVMAPGREVINITSPFSGTLRVRWTITGTTGPAFTFSVDWFAE